MQNHKWKRIYGRSLHTAHPRDNDFYSYLVPYIQNDDAQRAFSISATVGLDTFSSSSCAIQGIINVFPLSVHE